MMGTLGSNFELAEDRCIHVHQSLPQKSKALSISFALAYHEKIKNR